jgi:hypothetical protein
MRGKIFVWLLATVLQTTAPPTEAQQPTKIPRIGFLGTTSPSAISVCVEGFRHCGLRDEKPFAGNVRIV